MNVCSTNHGLLISYNASYVVYGVASARTIEAVLEEAEKNRHTKLVPHCTARKLTTGRLAPGTMLLRLYSYDRRVQSANDQL